MKWFKGKKKVIKNDDYYYNVGLDGPFYFFDQFLESYYEDELFKKYGINSENIKIIKMFNMEYEPYVYIMDSNKSGYNLNMPFSVAKNLYEESTFYKNLKRTKLIDEIIKNIN